MAQPPLYSRDYSFVGFQNANPTKPLPAVHVEAEFDAIADTLEQTLENLALIQRDDGKLANQSVHPEAIRSDAWLMVSGWLPRGDWVGGVTYAFKDVVAQSSNLYVCLVAHQSTANFAFDLAQGKWMNFTADVDAAVAAAAAALASEMAAAASAGAAATSASAAATSAGNAATSATQANASAVAAASSATAAAGSASAAASSAATIPSPAGGGQDYVRVKADNTGYERRTAAQVTQDITFLQAGTGGTARSVQDRLRDWVSIKDFSADAAGISAALAAHPGAVVPPGVYNTTTARVIPAGKHLELMPGASLTASGGGSWSWAPGASVHSKTEGLSGDVHYWGRKLTGPIASGSGILEGFSPAAYMFDVLTDDADNAHDFGVNMRIRHVFGGAATKGGRNALVVLLEQKGQTSAANTNRNYAAIQGLTYAWTGDGGTDTGVNSRGWYFGVAGATYIPALAANIGHATGTEFNTFIEPGATVRYVTGDYISGCNGARGVELDAALGISAQNQIGTFGPHIGYRHGICFTDTSGKEPLYSGSTVLGTYWMGGGTKPIAFGIDLLGFSISTAAFRSTGFQVNGLGDISCRVVRPSSFIELGNALSMRWDGTSPFAAGTDGAQLFMFNDGTFYFENYDGGWNWRTAGFASVATLSSAGAFRAAGPITAAPGASVTPANNGDVTFQLTSNTQITFKAKGSDGVVRSGNITLA